jgi:hypothetical protein
MTDDVIDGGDLIEANYPKIGPHCPQLIGSAGNALYELVRFLDYATLAEHRENSLADTATQLPSNLPNVATSKTYSCMPRPGSCRPAGRGAAALSLSSGLLGVLVDGHGRAGRMRLAGRDVPGVEFRAPEREVLVHLD